MFRSAVWVVTLAAIFVPASSSAQDRPARWQRRDRPTTIPVTVFHSTQAANLPTAETLRKGEWLFEISHRFLPPISDGADAFWGFDGPVFNRLGLAYAITDRAMVGVLRSNLNDNVELNGKVRLLESSSGEPVSFMVAAAGGIAWNTEAPQVRPDIGTPVQGYGQAIVNLGLGRRFAVGVVPTWLHNPRIADDVATDVFNVGLNGQLYLSDEVSLLGEWVVAEAQTDLEHDAATFGIELETGGHFFKVLVTNQARLNPTQFLAGTPFAVALDQMRVAFNVTRLLTF